MPRPYASTTCGRPETDLDRRAEPVIYVPWCATVANVLEAMLARRRRPAAVVNEIGETIGFITLDDILDTIFSGAPSRSERLLRRAPIRQIAPGMWHVTGLTSLRRLARHFHVERLPSKSVTVAGIVQEQLERLPQPGDECRWDRSGSKSSNAPLRGQILVELTKAELRRPSHDRRDVWLALLGLLLSALFSGAETGFYRAMRLRLVLDAMGGDSVARGLLFLANHPSLFVATALVGNSLANYLVTLAAVVILEGVLPGIWSNGSRRCCWPRCSWSMANCCRRICFSRPRIGCCGALGRYFSFSSRPCCPLAPGCGD